MTSHLTEVLLRCGHLVKVDLDAAPEKEPPRFYCPFGCGKQTFVVAL